LGGLAIRVDVELATGEHVPSLLNSGT
jgi:hypothetical protein